MVNKNYVRGRAFEYKVKKLLESKGWFVVRAAGSKGLFDLVAIRKKDIAFIQCKYGVMPSKKERNALDRFYKIQLAENAHCGYGVSIAFGKPKEEITFESPAGAKQSWIP